MDGDKDEPVYDDDKWFQLGMLAMKTKIKTTTTTTTTTTTREASTKLSVYEDRELAHNNWQKEGGLLFG